MEYNDKLRITISLVILWKVPKLCMRFVIKGRKIQDPTPLRLPIRGLRGRALSLIGSYYNETSLLRDQTSDFWALLEAGFIVWATLHIRYSNSHPAVKVPTIMPPTKRCQECHAKNDRLRAI